jgi:MFS family permease
MQRPISTVSRQIRLGRVATFFLASVFYWAAQYVYVPTLPAYVKSSVTSLAGVGVVLSMYGLWSAILRVPTGIFVDASRRERPIVVVGFLLASAGALVMGRGGSTGALMLGRALTGASTATWVPVMVMFSSFFPAERMIFATSLLAASTSVGQVIATACTGYLNGLGGYSLAFYTGAVLAACAALIIWAASARTESRGLVSTVSTRSILAVFVRPEVLLPSLTSAVCQFGLWAIVYAFLPLLARQMGASDVAVSVLLTVNLLANAATNVFTTFRVSAVMRQRWLLLSFAAFAVGAGVAALAQSVVGLSCATIIIGAANGIFYPLLVGLSIERVDVSHRSTAMGIHQAIYALGTFAGPWAGGILSDALGMRVMFGIMGGFCLPMASALVLLADRKRRTDLADRDS